MKRYLWSLGLGLGLTIAASLTAPAALADAPSIQLNPLKYEDVLTTTKVKTGYIDVSNPSDSPITILTSVKGFHQTDLEGRLGFSDDAEIQAGIKVDLDRFNLGPREALKVAFTVDPSKLPKGGIYAAIFFRTLPPDQTSNTSFVSESANVGTLLLLDNGDSHAHRGVVSSLNLPWLQVGEGIGGELVYHNTDLARQAIGFRPALKTRAYPWGAPTDVATAMVLPGSSRRFVIDRPGSFFGIVPLTVTDSDSGHHVTGWIIACTGYYRLAAPIGLVVLILIIWFTRRWLRRVWRAIKRLTRRRRARIQRPLDGISRKR